MRRSRDRWIAAGAALLVVGVAVMIVLSVLLAERNGRDALEELEREQVQQLARSMNNQIEGITGIANGLRKAPFSLRPEDPADVQRLAALSLDPNARTGLILVDAEGTVTNGVLLGTVRVGARVQVDGLETAIRAPSASILPVQPGLTTASLSVPVVFPLEGGRGAVIAELEVSADSQFNAQVSPLGRGDTGEFLFVDRTGTALASSNPALLGHLVPDAAGLIGHPGFVRRNGRVLVAADVPSAGWTAVFRQDASEFEGGLTGPIQNAVVLVAVVAVLATGVMTASLLRRLRASREEQRRLAEINAAREEFVSIVSHELRTPVAGVLGFLETSLDHWDRMTDADRRNAVTRAVANAQRLQALTRDVLDTASIEAGEFTCTLEPVDLAAVVEMAVVAAADAHPGREIIYERPDDPVPVRADADRLQQVLANLIDNAVKSSPAGTTVAVGLTVAAGAREAVVAVRDSGPGLPSSSLDRVFDKFVRARGQTVRGTGLGLYISRQIVDAHGGRIWAENLPGRGASLSFTMPLAP